MSSRPNVPVSRFIDTNVWLYAFIRGQDPIKSERAAQLLSEDVPTILSTQVINETCVNLLKKASASESTIQELVHSFYSKYVVVDLDQPTLITASTLRDQYSISYWDSLIIASALNCGAQTLVTEDMQDGLVVESQLTIVNPFTTPGRA